LLFDAGDLLYDATPGRRRLLRVLAQMGLHTQYGCFFRIWERNFLRDVHRGICPYHEAFRAFLTSFGFESAQIDEVEVATNLRRRELEAPERLLPGVRDTLMRRDLSGISLGVLCNSTATGQQIESRLGELGLTGRFSWCLSSIDLGCALPDRAAYRAALETMRLAAEEVAFVGHDGDELAGAALVGMPTIAINYDHDAVADVYLEHFQQLGGIVEPKSAMRLAG
jgi:FMN phosphatase YigB (HAD superfamily)